MNAGLHHVHPGELHESERNPRSITVVNFDALKYALEKDPYMLDARPLIATLDGEVIAGNMRHRAIMHALSDQDGYPNLNAFLKERGGVPTFLAELDPARKREWMLRDNNPYGDYVAEELEALVREHEADGGDLRLTGFDDDDLDVILKRDGGGGSPDEPSAGDPPLDVWGVIVECDDEQQQADLLERLEGEGFIVRAML